MRTVMQTTLALLSKERLLDGFLRAGFLPFRQPAGALRYFLSHTTEHFSSPNSQMWLQSLRYHSAQDGVSSGEKAPGFRASRYV
jgi:hypothetical protein